MASPLLDHFRIAQLLHCDTEIKKHNRTTNDSSLGKSHLKQEEMIVESQTPKGAKVQSLEEHSLSCLVYLFFTDDFTFPLSRPLLVFPE